MITEKAWRTAATELSEVLNLDPVIDAKAKIAVVQKQVREAIVLINPEEGDTPESFTEGTLAVVLEERPDIFPSDEAPEEEAAEEGEGEAEAEEEAGEAPLQEQIEGTDDLADLKEIASANPEFKVLKTKLGTYKKAALLKADMLASIEVEEEQEQAEEIHQKNVGKAPVRGGAAKLAAGKPAAGTEKKKTPFVSTKEKLGTSRGLEVIKAMQSIKGAQTMDAIAKIADDKFVKAGGATNIKQSKNIIKVLLEAAQEWGIVVVKGDKLSNA